MRVWFSILALMFVVACAEKRREAGVWESYDVRHPVPAGSTVPDSYARQYDAYRDNDSYYTPPGCSSGFDGPSCLGTE